MKVFCSIFMVMMLACGSVFAFAPGYHAPTKVDKFYACLDNVNKVVCNYTQYDWKSDPTASTKFYNCYTPARKKCGCDNDIAAECTL